MLNTAVHFQHEQTLKRCVRQPVSSRCSYQTSNTKKSFDRRRRWQGCVIFHKCCLDMWVCQQARKFLIWVIQVVHDLYLDCIFTTSCNWASLPLSPSGSASTNVRAIPIILIICTGCTNMIIEVRMLDLSAILLNTHRSSLIDWLSWENTYNLIFDLLLIIKIKITEKVI